MMDEYYIYTHMNNNFVYYFLTCGILIYKNLFRTYLFDLLRSFIYIYILTNQILIELPENDFWKSRIEIIRPSNSAEGTGTEIERLWMSLSSLVHL